MRGALAWAVPYYAATLVFVGLDVALGANLRAVAFEAHPELRGLYYALLLACGLLAHARPRWSAPVTLLESSASLVVLAVGVLAPYYVFAVELREPPAADPRALVFNFLLCGTAAVLAFERALGVLAANPPGRRGSRV